MICDKLSKEDRKRIRAAIRETVQKPEAIREDIAFSLSEDGKLGKRYTSLGHVPKGEGAVLIPRELTHDLKPSLPDVIDMFRGDRPVMCRGTKIGLVYDANCYTSKGMFNILKADHHRQNESLRDFKGLGELREEIGLRYVRPEELIPVPYGIEIPTKEGRPYTTPYRRELRKRAGILSIHIQQLMDKGEVLDTCSLSLMGKGVEEE